MFNFFLYSLLPFLFILGFCITIHEFGHFIMAKLFHIPVEKFSIGYGPPIIRKKIGETDFRIAYFPLGGYVKMTGEDEGEIIQKKKEILQSVEEKSGLIVDAPDVFSVTKEQEVKPDFYDAPIIARILVIFNGPFFNILSAFFVFFLIFLLYGVVITPYTRIQLEENSPFASLGFQSNDSIVSVNGKVVTTWEDIWTAIEEAPGHDVEVLVIRGAEEHRFRAAIEPSMEGLVPLIPPILGTLKINSPAHKAGMREGDRILKINDQPIRSWNEMVDLVRVSPGMPLDFVWQHNDHVLQAHITPERLYDPIAKDTIGQIGVFIPHARRFLAVPSALRLAIIRTIDLIGYVFDIFRKLFTREISARQLGGPIAIFRLSTESAEWGFERLLMFLVIISINLGIINLVPLPALDGGHIVMGTIEGIRRKRFSRKTRLVIQQIGYALLLLLIIFVTFNDITR
jgi:regulator of sigma E protease